MREDPVRRGLLYAGTELGVFVSFNDGADWQPLQLNLPASPIHDLVIKNDDLVVATHGRAFWILDDVTPLRQLRPQMAQTAAVLFTPEKAIRLFYPDDVDSRHPVGQNPPAGAIIDYALKSAPKGELTVDILDDKGALMRHLSSTKSDKEIQPPEWPDRIVDTGLIPAKAGMNRLVWDLRMSDPVQIPGAFYSDQAPRGPVVADGHYTVKLTVDGQSQTAPLTIVADPRAGGSEAAIQAKTALAVATVRDIDALHRAVNAVRHAEADLARVQHAVGTCDSAKPVTQEAAALSQKLAGVEGELMQVNMKGSEANLAFPGKLNEQYASFANSLGDADTMPTAQHKAFYNSLHTQLQTQLAAWHDLQANAVTTFNNNLKQTGACPIE